jgi:alpha-amylase
MKTVKANTSTVDGLRIDTAQQTNPSFWPSFQAAAGGIHVIGEIWQASPDLVCPYQNSMSGVMNFPTYYWITQAFSRSTGSMANLVNGLNWMKAVCKDTTLQGAFTENHDIGRLPSMTRDLAQIKNAIAFGMLMDGIPIIYQGQEQGFNGNDVPANREYLWSSKYNKDTELYKFIRLLNTIRKLAISRDSAHVTTKASSIYSDTHSIVMRKGTSGRQIVSVYTNNGSNWSGAVTVKGNVAGFGAFQKLYNVVACKPMTTNRNGDVSVPIVNGQPVVLYPTTELRGSGLCGL